MNPELVTRIFGCLQSLEKSHSNVSRLLPLATSSKSEIAALLPQQAKVLANMRRQANHLQLQIAKKQWASAIRTINVFYGLQHMIRQDLIAAQKTLISAEAIAYKTVCPEAEAGSYH